MPVKAVLFDLDNTLIDFMKMKQVCCSRAVDAMIAAGLKLPNKRAMTLIFRLYDRHGMEYQKIFQVFLKEAAGKVDYAVLASGIVAYRRARVNMLEPYPGVESMLLRLKMSGYRLGIVTDAPRMKAWMRLAAMNIIRYFDFVITRDDVGGREKPSRMPFKAAIRKLGLPPSEILFVGDSVIKDIAGANRAGMHSCLARYGENKRHAGRAKPEFSLSAPSGIFRTLEKLNSPKSVGNR